MIYFIALLVAGAVWLLIPVKKASPLRSSLGAVVLANPEQPRPPSEREAIAAVFLIDDYLKSIGKSEVDRSMLRHQSLLEIHGEEA